MYLTQHIDYGLRVLVYTVINGDTLVDIGAIAETYNISESRLMKVVTPLVKGGFLVSVRDKDGGLRLADVFKKIDIGAVVRHLEPIQVVECMGDNNECLITPSCRLTGIITDAIKTFLNHLDQYSLRSLLDGPTYDILYTPHIPTNEIHGTAD